MWNFHGLASHENATSQPEGMSETMNTVKYRSITRLQATDFLCHIIYLSFFH